MSVVRYLKLCILLDQIVQVTLSGWKDIGIRKVKFVAKTQFLWLDFQHKYIMGLAWNYISE